MTTEASALITSQIQEKNLVAARMQFNQGNTTGAVWNILPILEREFKEIHPKITQQ
jgi:hypothetical protein